jgi:GNAT superfamily N-acetyltransferase
MVITAVVLFLVFVLVWVIRSRRQYEAGKSMRRVLPPGHETDVVHGAGLQVSYGSDYPAFFRSLGDAAYMYKLDRNGGVQCGVYFVLRGTPAGKCFFVADYRVREEHRGRWLGFRFMLAAIAWPWLLCPRMYALCMGTSFPNYLRWFRPFLQTTLVRFVVMTYRDLIDRRLPDRYIPLKVSDRKGVKDLFVNGARLDVLHLCPFNAPAGSDGREITVSDRTRQFMMMLLPGEDVSGEHIVLLPGILVHTAFPRIASFDWLGSGDL